MKNLTVEWLQAALVRAVKTIAQTAVGMISVGAALNEISWDYILSVSIVAGILSILTSIAGLPETSYDAEASIDEDGILKVDNVHLKDSESKTLRLKVKK